MEKGRLAIETFGRIGMRHGVARSTDCLGDTYAATDDTRSALVLWRRAVDILDNPDDPATPSIHAKIAQSAPIDH